MKYSFYNPNPDRSRVGDCTVRAISKALGQDWETTYTGLCLQGFVEHNMPSGNDVWGAYLRKMGFRRNIVPDSCPDCYSVADFAVDHLCGTYILALPGHVVCIQDGVLYDTWDSQDETVLYYWERTDT